MKDVPVYKYPASQAQEHDELNAYRASSKANMACKEAIEASIRDHYRDNHLGSDAVKQVVEQFGYCMNGISWAKSTLIPTRQKRRRVMNCF